MSLDSFDVILIFKPNKIKDDHSCVPIKEAFCLRFALSLIDFIRETSKSTDKLYVDASPLVPYSQVAINCQRGVLFPMCGLHLTLSLGELTIEPVSSDSYRSSQTSRQFFSISI
jgi:hypothetical protein